MKVASNLPVPKNSHDIKKFSGFAGYYREHIKSFASRSFHLRQHFTIQTDYADLQWLQFVSSQKGRLARWVMCLAEYEFDLQHKPSHTNGNPDIFSRCPIETNLHYTTAFYSDPFLEPFADLKTCITLYSMLGLDHPDNISTTHTSGNIPFDFVFDSFVNTTDHSKHDKDTEDDSLSDVTALQPSLVEFRAQQRACPELGEIINYLEHTSPDKLGQKVAGKNLRSLQVKCKNYFIDPLDGCLKYLDPLADVTDNYLFVVPVTLRRQFLYAHHNAPLSGGHRGHDVT